MTNLFHQTYVLFTLICRSLSYPFRSLVVSYWGKLVDKKHYTKICLYDWKRLTWVVFQSSSILYSIYDNLNISSKFIRNLGILRNKTMDHTLIYIPHHEKQYYFLCWLNYSLKSLTLLLFKMSNLLNIEYVILVLRMKCIMATFKFKQT